MRYYLRGEIAKLANVNIETLRYYERNKILPIPFRSENGYRQYTEDDLKKIRLVLQLKECSFSLKEIKQLFPQIDAKKLIMTEALSIIEKKLTDVDDRLQNLEKLKCLLIEMKSEITEPKCPAFQKFIEEYT